MKKLGYPALFCNTLEVAENGEIKDAKTLVLIYKASRRLGI